MTNDTKVYYKDVEYGLDNHERWYFIAPSTQRLYPHDNSEVGVKDAIDGLRAMVGLEYDGL